MPPSTEDAVTAAMRPVLDVRMGDLLEMRKPHACGGREWRVSRLGADIGVICQTCGRRVILERGELEKRLRGSIRRGPAE